MPTVQNIGCGAHDVLDVIDLPGPVPGDGQKVYDARPAGVNFADTRQS